MSQAMELLNCLTLARSFPNWNEIDEGTARLVERKDVHICQNHKDPETLLFALNFEGKKQRIRISFLSTECFFILNTFSRKISFGPSDLQSGGLSSAAVNPLSRS
jgi:hypothetical protein